jgi:hypothetical protein
MIMGYKIQVKESSFLIPAEKVHAAVDALISHNEMTYQQQLLEWATLNAEGDIVAYDLKGTLGWQERVLKILAPYVKDGSYFMMVGEDLLMWVWAFKGGQLFELPVTTSWKFPKETKRIRKTYTIHTGKGALQISVEGDKRTIEERVNKKMQELAKAVAKKQIG